MRLCHGGGLRYSYGSPILNAYLILVVKSVDSNLTSGTINAGKSGSFQSFALSLALRFVACIPTFNISDLPEGFIRLSEIRTNSKLEASVAPSDNNGPYFSDFWAKWCLVVLANPWAFAL